jgi:hypothetical protein
MSDHNWTIKDALAFAAGEMDADIKSCDDWDIRATAALDVLATAMRRVQASGDYAAGLEEGRRRERADVVAWIDHPDSSPQIENGWAYSDGIKAGDHVGASK